MTRKICILYVLACLCSCDNVFSSRSSDPVSDELKKSGLPGYRLSKSSCYIWSSSKNAYEIIEMFVYTYAPNGRLSSITCYADGSTSPLVQFTYTYNAKGLVSKFSNIEILEPFQTWHYYYSYDFQDRLITMNLYRNDMSLIDCTSWQYQATVTIEQTFDPDNTLKNKTISYYDESGLLERKDIYNSSVLNSYWLYSYHENGFLKEKGHYLADNSPCLRVAYQYDVSWHILAEQSFNADDSLHYSAALEYNDNGDIIKVTYSGEGISGGYSTYEYEYVTDSYIPNSEFNPRILRY